jgi:polyhydroxyalkanoate synthesis regulator protein
MIEIIKYPNRRLYGPQKLTGKRGYLTLGDIRKLIEEGERVCVRPHGSRRLITEEVLLEILKERELERPRMTQEQICNLICAP